MCSYASSRFQERTIGFYSTNAFIENLFQKYNTVKHFVKCTDIAYSDMITLLDKRAPKCPDITAPNLQKLQDDSWK